jgi:hypothetical protein
MCLGRHLLQVHAICNFYPKIGRFMDDTTRLSVALVDQNNATKRTVIFMDAVNPAAAGCKQLFKLLKDACQNVCNVDCRHANHQF